MKTNIKIFSIILNTVVLLLFSSVSAFAEVLLPDGAAAGLPSKLTILDSAGNSVSSSTGEFFFEVENMQPYEKYTKKVHIMNLREDRAYRIWFYAEPVSKSGETDLEKECESTVSLNSEKIFEGSVYGQSDTVSLQTPFDLGSFAPGESASLSFSVSWNPPSKLTDNGHKLIDDEGVHTLREGSKDSTADGEIKFRWVFYAAVDEEYVPPQTGIMSVNFRLFLAAAVSVGVMIMILLIMIIMKKRKNSRQR